MAIHADHVDMIQRGGTAIHINRAVDGDTELVLFQPGGDVRVSTGIHVRIDAEGDRRLDAHLTGHRIDAIQLGIGFDVEAENTDFQRAADLGGLLADT